MLILYHSLSSLLITTSFFVDITAFFQKYLTQKYMTWFKQKQQIDMIYEI